MILGCLTCLIAVESERPTPHLCQPDNAQPVCGVERELLAGGELLKPVVGAVADDRPETGQPFDPLPQELAPGDHVVQPGRAGRRGDRQAQDLDQEGALGLRRPARTEHPQRHARRHRAHSRRDSRASVSDGRGRR